MAAFLLYKIRVSKGGFTLWKCLYDRLTIIQVAQILQISVELVSFFATRGEKVINIEKGGNIEKKELYTKL